MTAGTVTLVGAGPGDPELLTLKAVRAIARATVLLVDDLVGDEVLAFAASGARIVHVGKRGGCRSTPQSFIDKLMAAEAANGETVVRLKGGDPFIFGRGGEEAERLRAQGITVEVVSGITSGLAAVTSLGVPLTHREHAHGVIFVTAHPRADGAALDWRPLAAAAAQGLTLVVYMGVTSIDALQSGLLLGLPHSTPAAVVQHASQPQQRQLLCTLGSLAASVRAGRIGSPAIVIVGDVLRGAQTLPQTDATEHAA
jgi:uroporphyrin-III C-methyltransferase